MPFVSNAVQGFMGNVFAQFNAPTPISSNITDLIFSFIEHDRVLLKAYLDLLADNNLSLQDVNSQIARAIQENYDLPKAANGELPAVSLLIQTYSPL